MQLGARRDVTDVLRTVFWYEGLLLQTKETTAYKLAKKFDPDSFGFKNDVPYSSSKWQKYAKGKHTPSIAKVMAVERAAPGSYSEINHVLWKVLKLNYRSIARNIDDSLMQLDLSVRFLIYKYAGPEDRMTRRAVTTSLLDSVVRKGSIDSLACLTILLREADYLLQEELVFEIALRLHQTLLMLGASFDERRIGNALVQLYSERIFSIVKWRRYTFYIENEKFMESSYLLNELAFGISETRTKKWESRVQRMLQILEGRYGFHWCLALQPIYGPSKNSPNSGEALQFTKRRNQYLKAWEFIYAKEY
jgi:hypothetical protein